MQRDSQNHRMVILRFLNALVFSECIWEPSAVQFGEAVQMDVGSLTFASVAGLTLLVSCRAFALIRTYCVDAVTSLTEARNGLTFIHIYREKSKDIRKYSHCNG